MALLPSQPLFTVKVFLGIANQGDATKLLPAGGKSYQATASNVDIDDDGMPHRRKGYAAVSYSGTAVHSLWGNGETALFVDNGTLKILNLDFTATNLRTSVGSGRMAYAESADRIFYTNSQVIGYVKDRAGYLFPAPTMTFRIPMPAGQLIEWFNGRLYVAREKVIRYSDPMYPGQTHEQKGFTAFAGRITLLRAIRNTGILVSDSHKTYLMEGLDAPAMKLRKLCDYPAILGTDAKTDGTKLGGDLSGEVVLWLSREGICLAGEGGTFRAATRKFYWPASTAEGNAIMRETQGFNQYLVTQAT